MNGGNGPFHWSVFRLEFGKKGLSEFTMVKSVG